MDFHSMNQCSNKSNSFQVALCPFHFDEALAKNKTMLAAVSGSWALSFEFRMEFNGWLGFRKGCGWTLNHPLIGNIFRIEGLET